MINIVLDIDVILDLLAVSPNDVQHCFVRLQKLPMRFWLPCCLLSLLETQMSSSRHQPLSTLLTNEHTHWLSSSAAHWQDIPSDHPSKTQAMMTLDAATLPGHTLIWTNNPDFASAHADIEYGDHESIYGLLAQYEDELPFVDLTQQQLKLRPALEKSIFTVLKHGQYILGPEVQRLEDQLAAYVGCQHCVTVANGTEALLIALMAIGVKPGDEVITSPFSFVANAETIAFLGAKPIFVDIDPQTYLLDPTTLEAAITPKTKAIIAVNLYGQCADFDVINQIARQYYLPVIEDAAQSFGAGYKDRRSGALSTIGCTSFFPSKPLGAYGDGGACFTDDDQLAEMMRHLRIHGQSERYQHNILGLNSRLDTLQASLLLAKLPIFDQEIEKRNQIGQHYTQLLRDKVQTPVIAAHNTSVYAQYTIEVDNRDNVSTQLHQRGIPTAVHYPLPVHLQPALAHLRYEAGQFPVAERAAQRVLNLPLYPYMHLEAVEQVAEELVKVLPS